MYDIQTQRSRWTIRLHKGEYLQHGKSFLRTTVNQNHYKKIIIILSQNQNLHVRYIIIKTYLEEMYYEFFFITLIAMHSTHLARCLVLDNQNSPDDMDIYSERSYNQTISRERSNLTSRSFPLMNKSKFNRHNMHNRANYTKSAAFPMINWDMLPDINDPLRRKRDGIFVKLTQISNPGSRKALSVDAEEFTYLTQLKRRIGRNLDDYNPYKHLDTTGMEENALGVSRPCRKGQPRKQTSTLSALKGSKSQNGLK